MKEKRNGIISLWKFLFAIVIAFFHCSQFYQDIKNPFFPGGYIAVEFFFIVSGFFFAASALKKRYSKKTIGTDTLKFIYKKICSFIPYILIAYIFSLIVQAYYSNWGISKILNSFWNLCLLKYFGFGDVIMLGQLWYIAYMLLVMFILYPIVVKYKANFIKLISPIIVIISLGFLYETYGTINHLDKIFYGMIPTGILRALAEINIGMIVFLISSKIKNISFKKIFLIITSVISELLLVTILLVILFIPNIKKYELIMLLMLSISLIIFTSNKCIELKLLSNKIIYFLEKLSLPIYLNHTIFVVILDYGSLFQKFSPISKSIITVVATIIFSIIEIKIITYIQNKKIINKIKKIIISENKT